MVNLLVPEGIDTVSFGGTAYAAENGTVQVPQEAAEYLYQYGFMPSENGVKSAEVPKAKRKAEAADD
ncbi:MAG: hypothetical protein Q4D82_01400 [Neisseria sp.]|nr:hypothetical protein [Neisseria sp.]